MIISIILTVLLGILFIGVVIVIIFDQGDSGTKMAWLLAITFIPVIGVILLTETIGLFDIGNPEKNSYICTEPLDTGT